MQNLKTLIERAQTQGACEGALSEIAKCTTIDELRVHPQVVSWAIWLKDNNLLPVEMIKAYDLACSEAGKAYDLTMSEPRKAYDLAYSEAGKAYDLTMSEPRKAYDLAYSEAGKALNLAYSEAGKAFDLACSEADKALINSIYEWLK